MYHWKEPIEHFSQVSDYKINQDKSIMLGLNITQELKKLNSLPLQKQNGSPGHQIFRNSFFKF